MILQFQNDEDNELDLNPQKNLTNFQLSNLQIMSNQQKNKIRFNSYNETLIINEVQMNNQIIKSQYIFENITTIIINNFDMIKLEIQNDLDLFKFKDIIKVVIRNFTVINTHLNPTLMSFKNVSQIEINNFNISNSIIGNGIISAQLIKNISLQNINVQNNSMKYIQQMNLQQDYFYFLNLRYVEQSNISSIQIENTTIGLINVEGEQVNSQNTNILSINQVNLTNINIRMPIIKAKYLKKFNLAQQKVESVQYLSRTNFFQIEQSDEVEIQKFSFKNMIRNPTINKIRVLESQDEKDNNNYFLFSLQGIIKTIFKHSYFNIQNYTGIFNITNYQASKYYFIRSGSLEIYNVTVENSFIDIPSQSLFNFQNEYTKLEKININKTKSSYHLIEANQCENFEIVQSKFIENQSLQNGGSIYISSVTNVKIDNSTFQRNIAQISGGAIYLIKSNINVISSVFDSNISVLEKGGAICSINSYLNLYNTTIINNKAIIGGGIYHDSPKSSNISSDSKLEKNRGYFYGSNTGSKPQSLKQINSLNETQHGPIQIAQFQSGNYTKEAVYVQFYDEEGNFLNFLFNKNHTKDIQKEIDEYKIQLDLQDELQISYGKQLAFDSDSKHFKLNVTVSYKDKLELKGILTTNLPKEDIYLNVEFKFRNCLIGEIKQKNINQIICFECQTDTYSLEDPNTSNAVCKRCPLEAQNCYASTIILKDNYWKPSNYTDNIYSCPSSGCSESKNSISGCIEGYVGPVCASCDYRGQIWEKKYGIQGNDCYLCSDLMFVYVYLVGTIVFYVFYINFSINSYILQKSLIIQLGYLRKMDLLFLSKTRDSGADSTVLTKIFLHYIQIFSVSLDFFSSLPIGIKNIFSVFGDPSKATGNSYDCMFSSSFIPQLWLNRLTVLCSQISLTLLTTLIIRKYVNRENPKQFRKRIYVLFLYFFYYSSITKLLISLCLCKEFGEKSYLQGDYLQECWATDHIIISVLLIYPLTITWSLIIPILLLKKIKTALDQNKSQSISYILSFYFIQQGYKDKYYYWEIFKMFQKCLIMVCLNTTYSKHVQRVMISLICLIYLLRLQKLKPYNSQSLMKIEYLFSQVILYSLILSLIYDTTSSDSFISILIVLVISIVNFYGLIKFINEFLLITKLKIRRQNDSKLKTILLKIKYFRKYLQKSNVSIIRISFLWKKLRQAIYENKQNLNIYSKGLSLFSQNKQKEVMINLKSNEAFENSCQDLIAITSQINSPIISTIITARQEKKFSIEFEHILKQK